MPVKRYDPAGDMEVSYFHDDFAGQNRSLRIWSVTGTGASAMSSSPELGGLVYVRANASSTYALYMTTLNFSMAKKASFQCRASIEALDSMSAWFGIGASSAAEALFMGYDSAVGGNWLLKSITGSSPTVIDTGIAADTSLHEFWFECDTGMATCLLDGVPRGNMVSTLPTGLLSPYIRVASTTAAATRQALVDWIEVYGGRP